MANYPTLSFLYPFVVTQRSSTVRSDSGRGSVLRRKQISRQLARISSSHILTDANFETLANFHRARGGAYESFCLTDPLSSSWDGVFVGTGDASTTEFDLPSKTTTDLTVYVDGVEQTLGSEYSFGDADGTDGRDTITFTVYPNAGEVVTFDGTGYRAYQVTFERDELSATREFSSRRLRVPVSFLEVIS